MINFEQVDEARKVLGLGEEASMAEIKGAFRNLALRSHPDRCKDEERKRSEDMFKKINHAKDIVENYCANYRFSFKEKDVKKNLMDRETYEHLKRFYDGWLGDLNL
ncbi:MAG: DnaJ domain-containing protein [Candidatus Omnitrophica bacterium]|nr:DnaJ domain-containing protein [Candidatus Omnitrophota bacterium]